jgi:hypothetical protein
VRAPAGRTSPRQHRAPQLWLAALPGAVRDFPAKPSLVTAMFTPSIGHWYAGKVATRGLGLRAAGGATALLGLGASLSECPIIGESDCTPALGLALMVLGGAVFVGGMVDDLVTAPRRVRRYNQERGFGVAPIVTPGSAGLALAGQF